MFLVRIFICSMTTFFDVSSLPAVFSPSLFLSFLCIDYSSLKQVIFFPLPMGLQYKSGWGCLPGRLYFPYDPRLIQVHSALNSFQPMVRLFQCKVSPPYCHRDRWLPTNMASLGNVSFSPGPHQDSCYQHMHPLSNVENGDLLYCTSRYCTSRCAPHLQGECFLAVLRLLGLVSSLHFLLSVPLLKIPCLGQLSHLRYILGVSCLH